MQATFEDELRDQAIAKRHSLTCEAVDIGQQVRTTRLVSKLGSRKRSVLLHFKLLARGQ